jgi:hypothetical protein
MSSSPGSVKATRVIAAASDRPRLRLSDVERIAAHQANQLAKYFVAHGNHAMPSEPASLLADRLRFAAEELEAKDAERKPCYVVTEALDLDALGLTNQYVALPMLAGSDCHDVGCAHRTRFVSSNATKSAGRDCGLVLPPPDCRKEIPGLNDPQLRLLIQRLLAVLADIREHQVCSRARSVPPQIAPIALASRAVAHFSPKLAVRRHLGGFLTGIGISGLFGALLYLLTA